VAEVSDPVVDVVRTVAARLEDGLPTTIKALVTATGWGFGTCQRLHLEARRRGWLTAEGAPTPEGLVAAGRL
jgi:hypothetical protein